MPTLAQLRTEILGRLPSETHRSLFSLVELESRKDGTVIVRIPNGVDALDESWDVAKEVIERHRLKARRADKYATIEDLKDLLGRVHWLWKSWLPFGFLTLLVGEPGGGKSMVALDFARIVTRAATWPQETVNTDPGCVIWVETEAGQQLLMERSEAMNTDRKQIFIPSFDGDILTQPDLMEPGHQERITNLVKVKHPALVVVDSLGGAHTRGENKIEEVRPLLAYLAQLARDEDVAVVMVHHLRKRSMNEDLVVTLDRVRGSSGITAFARSIIAIERMRGDNGSMVKVIKTNLCRPPAPLIAKMSYDANENVSRIDYSPWEAPTPKKTKRDKAVEWIFSYLMTNGKVSLKSLIEAALPEGYTRAMIYNARSALGDSIAVEGTGNSATWELVAPINPLTETEE